MLQLDARLALAEELLGRCETLYDIGSNHGFLAVHMLLTIEIRTKEQPKREQVAIPTGEGAGGTKLNSHAYSSTLGLMDLIIDTIEQQHQPSAGVGGAIKDFFRSLLGG